MSPRSSRGERRRHRDGRVGAGRSGGLGMNGDGRLIWSPVIRPDRRLRSVLARRGACQLQKHVVERRPAQPEIAHRDSRPAQRRRRTLDHLQTIARRRKCQLREPLAGLRLTATDPCQRGPGVVPFRRSYELDLQDLPADPVLELAPGALGDHPTVVDHSDLVRELICLLEVLGRQQKRRPLAHELAHDRPDLIAAARI